MTLIDTFPVRNLGFNYVTTIIIPPWDVWKSKVQNDKGLRITVKYPLTGFESPKKIRLTVSTCSGFVDLESDKSSITFYNVGGVFECMFDIQSLSPYVALDPSKQHYVNIQLLEGENVGFDVQLTSFDIGGDIVTCTNGTVTPGFVFDPIKNSDRASVVREFSTGQVASFKIPAKTSTDWGDTAPNKVVVNVSNISGLPAAKRWELIISECPGSFEEALPVSVGRTRDYHLISSSRSGLIEIQYDNDGEVVSPGSAGPPLCSDNLQNIVRSFKIVDDSNNLRFRAEAYNMPENGVVTIEINLPVIRQKNPSHGVVTFETSFPVPGQYEPTTWDWNISECKGDFNTFPSLPGNTKQKCGKFSSGEQLAVLNAQYSGPIDDTKCKLDPDKIYYLNFRLNKCPGPTCGLNINHVTTTASGQTRNTGIVGIQQISGDL